MNKLALHWRIIIGLIVGIIYALVSSHLGWNKFTLDWIDPFGIIFIRLLKFIAVPLVLFSIISGISSLPDPAKLGRMGAKTLVAYLTTTVAAVSLGLFLVNMLKPGNYIAEEQRIKNRIKYEVWVDQTHEAEILDGKNYLSDPQYASLASSAAEEVAAESTDEKVKEKQEAAKSFKSAGPLTFLVDFVPDNIFAALSDGGRMLQVIFFAIFFGIMILLLPKETVSPVVQLINSINEIFLKMVEVIMEAAPFFVFALMAGVIAKMADTPGEVIEIFKGLLSYSVVVVLGL